MAAPTGSSYCGPAPTPDEWLGRWNLDPGALALLAALAWLWVLGARRAPAAERAAFGTGWGGLAIAFVSPLCALSVALFSARMAQHLLLVLGVAPLLVLGRFERTFSRSTAGFASAKFPVASSAAFAACWWLWHTPAPYALALRSDLAYAAMEGTLLASALWLWRSLLRGDGFAPLALGVATAAQMGLLGALLTFAATPLFAPHWATTAPFGLSALEDQQLAGLLCWIPGCAVLLVAGLLAGSRLLAARDLRESS